MVSRWYIVSFISILLTVLLLVLWFFIPGFPLLIFLLFPPLYCWGQRGEEKREDTEEPYPRPRYCPHCGKPLVEPYERFCPRCGQALSDQPD